MEEDVELIELKGTLVFLPFAVGSKSESIRPFLYITKDDIIKIMKTGDNPFENNALGPFDGHFLSVRGHYGIGKTFLIDEIMDLLACKCDSVEQKENEKEIETETGTTTETGV